MITQSPPITGITSPLDNQPNERIELPFNPRQEPEPEPKPDILGYNKRGSNSRGRARHLHGDKSPEISTDCIYKVFLKERPLYNSLSYIFFFGGGRGQVLF